MADLSLDILVIPTYNKLTMGIADNSVYPVSPPATDPTITIVIPNGLGTVNLPFTQNSFNVFNSSTLGLSDPTLPLQPLPDGVYTLTYTVNNPSPVSVTKNIQRVEVLQEKFDKAFMKLDMVECDMILKKQDKEDLTSVYFFIQGSIAAANNCAINTSNTLYIQANKLLNQFNRRECGCHGNNFVNGMKIHW